MERHPQKLFYFFGLERARLSRTTKSEHHIFVILQFWRKLSA
jgi:hypothetical protein